MRLELWDIIRLVWFATSGLGFIAFVLFIVTTHGRHDEPKGPK